jgi:23S rRNA pseudouridine2605 synthase
MEEMRLQRFLSQAGVAARRKAEELIVAGRVKVNGKVVTELGSKVHPERDHVQVDDEGIAAEEPFYVLFNKPKGCIVAVRDDRGRPTVMDYLPNLPASVAPVGRLDFYSEGVLLLTNDGELASKLLAPKSHVPKTYHVKIFGQITPKALQALRDGVRLDDGTTTQPAEVDELPGESKHSWLAITLYEGKSRQIHRMMEALGFTVQKLQRVAFANLTFHGLRVGDARELNQQELNELRELVGLPRKMVARGKWKALREQTDIARRHREKAKVEAEQERAAAEARATFARPTQQQDHEYADRANARRGSGGKPPPKPLPAAPRSKGAARPPSPPRKPQPARPAGPRGAGSRKPTKRRSR